MKSLQRMRVIVQARFSSRRLPGKVVAEVEGKPLLEHMLERVLVVFGKEAIILATSCDSSDHPVAEIGRRFGVSVFRGSLEDVLDRFYGAAKVHAADPVMRLTADSPLIEPVYLRDLAEAYNRGEFDYVSAKDPALFPRGTTGEILSRQALERCWLRGKSPDDREHVTWYIRTHPQEFKIGNLPPRPEWAGLTVRLALDDASDLELIRTLFSRLYRASPRFGLAEIKSLCEREPELFVSTRKG